MAITFLIVSMLLAGRSISEWLWQRDARLGRGGGRGRFESATAAGLVALALWVGVNWLLAGLHALRRGPLLACTILAAVAGVLGHARLPARGPLGDPGLRTPRILAVVALTPLLVWVGFILWRGWLLPVLNYDAVAYHLPRAILMARAGGFGTFGLPDYRAGYPADYELLLSNVLLLEGSDALTGWLSTGIFVLFLLATASLVERWWDRGPQVLAVVLLVAGSPVVLLHSGTHKNDLLENFYFLTGVMWAGRFVGYSGVTPLVLAVLASALAIGTKVQGAMLALALAPIILSAAWRHRRQAGALSRKEWFGLIALSLATLPLLGAVVYVVNYLQTGSPFGLPAQMWTRAGWGDWSNLWQFPYLLLRVPFDPIPDRVWVPWAGTSYYWLRYELFMSHLGAGFTVLAALLAFCLWRYARHMPDPAQHRERVATSVATLLVLLLLLPARLRPIGMFAFFARFVVFATPVLASWTVAPVERELTAGNRWMRAAAYGIVLATSVGFSAYAFNCARYDTSAPWPYVREAAKLGGTRVAFELRYKGCTIVDALAGPEDHIALDGGLDSCVYPLFGAALRRRVTFLPPVSSGPFDLPDDVQWVVVDHPWNRVWGHPQLTDMSRVPELFGRGPPSPEDLASVQRMMGDRRFRCVYGKWRKWGDQLVFQRIAPR
jgi:hypothetical protein